MSLELLTREAREDFLVLFTDAKSNPKPALGRYDADSAIVFLKEKMQEAYLQGIRDAKGCVPKKIGGGIGPAVVDVRAEGITQGHNDCRKETLEAITRLEEGT